MDIKNKVVVISGGTKGIGKELVSLFVSAGAKVFCLARSCVEKEENGVTFVPCDVSNRASVENAFTLVERKAGRIDILVNNAGMGISGSIENTTCEDFQYIFDVNVKGVFLCVKYALPMLRKCKGRIVNVSSVAGKLSIPYQSFYSATKAAVLSLSDALRNEVRPFGVKVLTVLPGDVKTEFTQARRKNKDEGVYADFAEQSVKVMEKDEQEGMTAKYAAKKIFRLSTRKSLPQTKVVGNKYKLLCVIASLLPKRTVNALLFSIYGGAKKKKGK